MALEILMQEVQNMSEDSLNEVIRFVRFIKMEKAGTSSDMEKKKRQGGWLQGTVVMSPDFDEPLTDFEEYM